MGGGRDERDAEAVILYTKYNGGVGSKGFKG